MPSANGRDLPDARTMAHSVTLSNRGMFGSDQTDWLANELQDAVKDRRGGCSDGTTRLEMASCTSRTGEQWPSNGPTSEVMGCRAGDV